MSKKCELHKFIQKFNKEARMRPQAHWLLSDIAIDTYHNKIHAEVKTL